MQQFKWHYGPTAARPLDEVDPPVYWCPLCGKPANPESWWTQEQLEYIQQSSLPHVVDELVTEMRRSFRGKKHIKFKDSGDRPESPGSLHEADDMIQVQSPCHSWEPVKIPEAHASSVYCLLCGTNFAV